MNARTRIKLAYRTVMDIYRLLAWPAGKYYVAAKHEGDEDA